MQESLVNGWMPTYVKSIVQQHSKKGLSSKIHIYIHVQCNISINTTYVQFPQTATTHALILKTFPRWMVTHIAHTQYNIPLQCSPHYVFSAANDLHFLYPTKRNAILQTKSNSLQHKTKASTLLCTFLFFPTTEKQRKEKWASSN